MKKTISVLITTTEKNKKFFEELVASLCKQTIAIVKVVVIYDGPLRPEKASFDKCPLPISWIDNYKGQSLTFLQNKAIQSTSDDFIMLLNDDVILEVNFIEELLSAFNKDDSIGMVCGKLLRMDKTTIDTAGQLLGPKRTPVERGYGTVDIGEFETECFIFGSCGAAVLLKRKMLEDCAITEGEFFDNDYNMFYEDLDLSWRAANRGWRAYYNPKAIAYHARGATAKEKEPVFELLRPYNFAWLKSSLKSDLIKNRLITIIKNDSPKGFLMNIHHILIYEIKIFIYCLIFDPKVIIQTIRNLPAILRAFRKRKIIKTRK